MATEPRGLKNLDWRKKLQEREEQTKKEAINKPAVAMGDQDKGKAIAQDAGKGRVTQVTADTILFEGLLGTVCRQWWENATSPSNIEVKIELTKARVHDAIQMPIFNIKEFEPCLRQMIKTYDPELPTLSFNFQHTDIIVSFNSNDFERVFGIPDKGKKIDKKVTKLSEERRTQLLKEMCRDNLTTEELSRILDPKGRGLKKTFLKSGIWQCLLDVVQSRLTGTSRASDTAVPMIALMAGLRKGTVYDWASLLSDKAHDCMMLKHKVFYMSHHAIGLFLDSVRDRLAGRGGDRST